ncbi:hemin uptake protein HemP [Methylobacterium sp. BTF04]|uniref:hemin uptake protein HemP n=1 Tax=Methylobacterium sp. BTF04 TaxID=2708300 RepID=UPI0013D36319|nr:hemin uptake protein HemP [Methylobacterium sp. BTF04]NEU12391.1 hemin uptake protein HemP [Methylobacterium sp. BTF04]
MSKLDSEISSAGLAARSVADARGAQIEAVITSAVLMDGRREVVIVHGGERYRLRITANDKLILTK